MCFGGPAHKASVFGKIRQLCANAAVDFLDLEDQPGGSYWIAHDQTPTGPLEAFALEVFEQHFGIHRACGINPPPDSGAEFWVQVMGSVCHTLSLCLLLSLSLFLSHALSLIFCLINGTQDLKNYSHADSLILSLSSVSRSALRN